MHWKTHRRFDALVLGAGLDIAVSPNATLGIACSGQIGFGVYDQAGTANLTFRF